tara:strand:+ start:9813 stop:10838 length:1026 start_codon:yes stop_codon:yes gene_type:complete
MKKKPKFSLDFEKPLRELEEQLHRLRDTSAENDIDVSSEIEAIEAKLEETKKEIYSGLSAWQKVQISRHPERPQALDYINELFTDFQELHGDRLFKDDRAVIGGTAMFEGNPVMVLAQQKGRNTKEKLLRNFGAPSPEGYRKALRLMKMANTFGLPIVSLIDTPGAYANVGAEERHVAEAIAVNLRSMSQLAVPIIAVVLGEGGSGGALGVALADKVLIFENAYYSVISPEGCAAILWKDRAYAPDAAEALKLTADKLLEFKIVDRVIPEPLGGAHLGPQMAKDNLRKALLEELVAIKDTKADKLIDTRYQKYRQLGVFEENTELLTAEAVKEEVAESATA